MGDDFTEAGVVVVYTPGQDPALQEPYTPAEFTDIVFPAEIIDAAHLMVPVEVPVGLAP